MTEPIVPRSSAPEHRPGFWQELEAAMSDPTMEQPAARPVSEGPAAEAETPTSLAPRRDRRRRAVVAAAAAILVLVGVALAVRPGSEPATELVVAPTGDDTAAPAPAAAGGDDGSTGDDTSDPFASDEPEPGGYDETGDPPAAVATAQPAPAVEPPVVEPDPAPLDSPYPAAPGNDDTEVWLPDRAMPRGSRFLATWEEAKLSWFGVVDPEADCSDDRYSRMVYVSGGGFAQPIADHAPGFSGDISHLTMSPDATRVAWLVHCDGQLEFYIATLSANTGRFADMRLAWVGRGSERSAFVLWQAGTVSLNGIGETGEPFFVDVDPIQGRVEGTGLPAETQPERDHWVVGATADGELTYWNVPTGGTCDGQSLFVRASDGSWRPALAEPSDAAGVVAFDIDQASAQVAFADACPGIDNGRFFLATLRADGLLSSVRTIDLSPFTTGHVAVLDWIDSQTLRVQTDESVTGGTVLRFDYRFDDGRDGGVLVQVD